MNNEPFEYSIYLNKNRLEIDDIICVHRINQLHPDKKFVCLNWGVNYINYGFRIKSLK